MPQAKLIGPQLIWDRHALDAAFEELPIGLPVPSYPVTPTTAGVKQQRTQIQVPPPTKEQIAAVRMQMDMDRYGQSTVG